MELSDLLDFFGLFEVIWAAGCAVAAVLGTIISGKGYKRRIAHLEEQAKQPTVVQNFYGDMGTVQVSDDGLYYAPFEGRGEIVSPRPVRIAGVGMAAFSGAPEVSLTVEAVDPDER